MRWVQLTTRLLCSVVTTSMLLYQEHLSRWFSISCYCSLTSAERLLFSLETETWRANSKPETSIMMQVFYHRPLQLLYHTLRYWWRIALWLLILRAAKLSPPPKKKRDSISGYTKFSDPFLAILHPTPHLLFIILFTYLFEIQSEHSIRRSSITCSC